MSKDRLTVLLLGVLISLPLVSLQVQGAEPKEWFGRGGPMATILFFELGELNRLLLLSGYAPLPKRIILMGGGGGGGLVEGFRFGGLGCGGAVSSASGEKKATLEFGFGGFLIERGLLTRRRYSLLLGAVIGGGGAQLGLRDRRPNPSADAIRLTQGFLALEIYAGVEVRVLDWLSLKVNLGYLWIFWTFGEPWKLGQVELPGSFNSPLIQVMISFGWQGKLEEIGEWRDKLLERMADELERIARKLRDKPGKERGHR